VELDGFQHGIRSERSKTEARGKFLGWRSILECGFGTSVAGETGKGTALKYG